MEKQCIRYYEWTKWFAWHPVKTVDNKIVWLEIVERRKFQDNKIDFAPVIIQYRVLINKDKL